MSLDDKTEFWKSYETGYKDGHSSAMADIQICIGEMTDFPDDKDFTLKNLVLYIKELEQKLNAQNNVQKT